MPDITITVSSQLMDLFPQAVTYYNNKNETSYTSKDMVKRLSIQFLSDTLHEIEHVEANDRFTTALDGVSEYDE